MTTRIVFVTDCVDVAYNELRAAVLARVGENSSVTIEPVARVAPFSVVDAVFTLRLLAEGYGPGTVFSVIVNPSKNRPARLIGRTEQGKIPFMLANNGTGTWLFRDFGISELYELHDPGFVSFGGKYVHAPAVAKIAMGDNLRALGTPFDQSKLVRVDVPSGTIVHVDNFGLMKFTGAIPEVGVGEQLLMTVHGKVVRATYTERMMSLETGTWAVYPGSSLGLFELGKVRQDGASELGVTAGEVLQVQKITRAA